MLKFFVGLALGVVGGAAVTIKVASHNPHIKRAIGDAVADATLNFIYGPRPESFDPQTRLARKPDGSYVGYRL